MIFENDYSYCKSFEKMEYEPNVQIKDVFYFSTICRVYISEGKSDDEIKDIMRPKIIKAFRLRDILFMEDAMDEYLEIAHSRPDLEYKPIIISKGELDHILEFENPELQKIIFVMICALKHNGKQRFYISDNELFRLSRCRVSMSNFRFLFSEVFKAGLFKTYHFKNKLYYYPTEELLSWDDGVEGIAFHNKENLIYRYLNYIGEGRYYICQECGSIEKKTANRSVLCRYCAKVHGVERHKKYNLRRSNDN